MSIYCVCVCVCVCVHARMCVYSASRSNTQYDDVSKRTSCSDWLPRCGKCRRYMKLVEAKPARLYCSICDSTYSLPQNGNIKLYKELKCPLDEFEILLWTTGAKGKVSSCRVCCVCVRACVLCAWLCVLCVWLCVCKCVHGLWFVCVCVLIMCK